MAEIIESTQNHIPSNGKVNSALTLGIIGTALSALNMGIGSSILGRRNWERNNWERHNWERFNDWDHYGRHRGGHDNNNDTDLNILSVSTPFTAFGMSPFGFGGFGNYGGYSAFGNGFDGRNAGITNEELYLERRTYQDELIREKEFYEGQMNVNEKLVNAFFDSYKRDVDNSFMLYKNQRDYADILGKKIDEVDKKVDIMAAVRPYQDALIDCKINHSSLMAQYNLDKRTCRMINGQVVLPSTPEVTGYGSYFNWPLTNTNS